MIPWNVSKLTPELSLFTDVAYPYPNIRKTYDTQAPGSGSIQFPTVAKYHPGKDSGSASGTIVYGQT